MDASDFMAWEKIRMAIETRSHERMATKADIAALEARLTEKINASERRLITWAIGIAVSSITALAGIGMLLYRLLVG